MSIRSQISDPDAQLRSSGAIKGHVYLVDDNDDIRRHFSIALRRYGLTVDDFESAEIFIEEALFQKPAVVLLDMSLPGANGVKAFEIIREAGWNTPVIFISGESTPVEIIDAMKMGASDFLWKPFTTSVLVDAIKNALAAERIQNEISTIDQARTNLWFAMTDREQEICALMLDGCGNAEIGMRLEVRADTIKKHRARILAKFSANSLSQLVDIFRGFTPPKGG